MAHGIMIEKGVMIRMRDSVELSCDIFRSSKHSHLVEEQMPVILVRTSYGKEQSKKQLDPVYFAQRGYVVVIQDVRGRNGSEGKFYPGSCEVEDGYDTLEWIAQQSWSNGKIGMTGISYVASVQHAAAISGTPYLTSMFYVKGCGDYYQHCFRRGGTFMTYRVPLSFSLAIKSKEAQKDPELRQSFTDAFSDSSNWIGRLPFQQGDTPLSVLPDYERYMLDQIWQMDYGQFWKKSPLWQPKEYLDKHSDVAGYYVTGWYDKYRADILYSALSAKRKSKPIKLLIGPYTHLDFDHYSGDVDFGSEVVMNDEDYLKLQLKWFDQTLKENNTGVLDEPPVKIFVMGGGDGRKTIGGKMNHGGTWRFENEWPLARALDTKYFLESKGGLSEFQQTQNDFSSVFFYDPNNPVPSIGGTSYFVQGNNYIDDDLRNLLFVPYGAYDQREKAEFFGCQTNLPLSSREDVLVFETFPLTQDLEITGPLTVVLWASSSCVDTDFSAKLIDVYPGNEDYPGGYAMNLTDSIIRARYRYGFEQPELMKPGTIYQFNIEMPPISNLFKAGHKIRLDISSSNYPTYDRNPNTGKTYAADSSSIVAENTIYHDAKHPSHVVLPIIATGN